nr:hypothetical protein Iba_chr06aCG10120 [Ipomoea batatas]
MSLILNLVRTATLFSDGFADWGADQDHRALVNLHRPVGNAPGPLEMKNTSVIRMFLRQGDLEKCGDNPEHASMGDEKCVFSINMIKSPSHAQREDLRVFTIRIIIGCAVTEEIKVLNAGWCLGDTKVLSGDGHYIVNAETIETVEIEMMIGFWSRISRNQCI